MKTKEVQFNRERICIPLMVSKELVSDTSIDFMEDYLRDTYQVRLNSFILSRLNEKQTITLTRKRPSFLEWLFRKPIVFEVEIECKEVMKNPPAIQNSVFMYNVIQG